jgi:hypothetical protein
MIAFSVQLMPAVELYLQIVIMLNFSFRVLSSLI